MNEKKNDCWLRSAVLLSIFSTFTGWVWLPWWLSCFQVYWGSWGGKLVACCGSLSHVLIVSRCCLCRFTVMLWWAGRVFHPIINSCCHSHLGIFIGSMNQVTKNKLLTFYSRRVVGEWMVSGLSWFISPGLALMSFSGGCCPGGGNHPLNDALSRLQMFTLLLPHCWRSKSQCFYGFQPQRFLKMRENKPLCQKMFFSTPGIRWLYSSSDTISSDCRLSRLHTHILSASGWSFFIEAYMDAAELVTFSPRHTRFHLAALASRGSPLWLSHRTSSPKSPE